MATIIRSSHENALKIYTVKIGARIASAPGWIKDHTGPMEDGQSEAQGKLEGRTLPGYPVVRIADLSKTPGAKVSYTIFDSLRGPPVMGERDLQGLGDPLFSSSQDIEINLASKVVDAGSFMTQKRINYQLLPVAEAQLGGWWPKFYNQAGMVQMAGARGTHNNSEWVVPLSTDAQFSEIMVNPVRAPTYNRHLVIDGSGFVQGGAQLASIDSTDIWTFDHIDALSTYIDTLEYKTQPVRVVDDPLADYEPIKGILYLSPLQHAQIRTQSSGRTWSDLTKLAWQRKDVGIRHPLFMGEVGLWNGILIRKMPTNHFIRFNASDTTKYVAAANRYVTDRNSQPTESDVTVNSSLSAGYAVERAIFMSAQSLGFVMGSGEANNFWFALGTERYNFKGTPAEKTKLAGMSIFGMAKLRAVFQNGSGQLEPTDHGTIVIDSAVKVPG